MARFQGAPACHASTLLEVDHGLLCAWFAGPEEGSRETAVWGSWQGEAPQQWAKAGTEPHWNPVLWREGESLLLYFKVGIYPKRWRTYVCVGSLEAGGPRWSEARELVPGDVGGRGPVKNKPIRLAEGVFLCGASLENDAGWDCFAERSHDGLVWEASPLVPRDESIPGRGIIQPTLWEISPSHVAMLCRSNAGCLVRSDSRDAGRTWEGARTTALPNNGSGVDLATLADGSLLLASNPVSDAWGARTPLTLQRSRDKGETWSQVAVLAEGPGEFSYPAVVASGKGALVSYTHDRREIRVVRWEPDA